MSRDKLESILAILDEAEKRGVDVSEAKRLIKGSIQSWIQAERVMAELEARNERGDADDE